MKEMRSIYQRFASCTRPILHRRIRRLSRPRIAPIGEHYPLVRVSGIQLSHHQSTNRERTYRVEKRSSTFVDRVRHVWRPSMLHRQNAKERKGGSESSRVLSSGHKILHLCCHLERNTWPKERQVGPVVAVNLGNCGEVNGNRTCLPIRRLRVALDARGKRKESRT